MKINNLEKRTKIRKISAQLFNDLPIEIRTLIIPSSITTQITELEIQKKCLKQAYNKGVKALEDKIGYLYSEAEKMIKDAKQIKDK